MTCLLWIQSLIYIPPQSLKWYKQHHIIYDSVITALGNTLYWKTCRHAPMSISMCNVCKYLCWQNGCISKTNTNTPTLDINISGDDRPPLLKWWTAKLNLKKLQRNYSGVTWTWNSYFPLSLNKQFQSVNTTHCFETSSICLTSIKVHTFLGWKINNRGKYLGQWMYPSSNNYGLFY